jgi:hypothetical protein
MDIKQKIAIACDADLRANTAIARKIANELTIGEAMACESCDCENLEN